MRIWAAKAPLPAADQTAADETVDGHVEAIDEAKAVLAAQTAVDAAITAARGISAADDLAAAITETEGLVSTATAEIGKLSAEAMRTAATADLTTGTGELLTLAINLRNQRSIQTEVERITGQINMQRLALGGHDKDAAGALNIAKENSDKLTTLAVPGDSSVAFANASAILKAKSDLAAALAYAEGIKNGLGALKDAIEDTPESGQAALLGLLEELEDGADETIATVQADLKTYEDMGYELDIALNDKGERTARAAADRVAAAISSALGGTGDSTVALVDLDGTDSDFDPGEAFSNQKMVEDTVRKGFTLSRLPDSARTWAQIHGLDPEGLQHVSVEGLEIEDFGGVTTPFVDTDTDTRIDLSTYENILYNGISVSLVCVANACEAEDGELGAGWVVVPDDPDGRYERVSGNRWRPAVYVEYAHWLNDDGEIQLYAAQGLGSAALGGNTAGTGTGAAPVPASATYSGTAAGMSVYTKDKVTSSGSFTADVGLTATFRGTDVGIGGKIDGFEGGANVNTGWTVRLDRKVFAPATTGELTTDYDGERGEDGSWTAFAYGGRDAGPVRPDGFYGAFDANFSDGQARGVYVTD